MSRAPRMVALSLLLVACGPRPAASGGDGDGDGGSPDAGAPDAGLPDSWAPWYGPWFWSSNDPGEQIDYAANVGFRELEFRGDGTVIVRLEVCPGILVPDPLPGELTARHEDVYTWEVGPSGYPRLTFVEHRGVEGWGHLYEGWTDLELRPGPACDALEVWGRQPGDREPKSVGITYQPGDVCMLACSEDYAPPDYSLFDYCSGEPPPPCE